MKRALAPASQTHDAQSREPQKHERSPADLWRAAVDDIAVDALAKSERYPAESLVPEGGE